MEVTRTFDFLDQYREKFPDKDDALAGKVNGEWVKYSSKAYIENSNNISYGLKELGYKAGDKISTICNNRPEWNFVDMGLAQLDIVHVPVFTTIDQKRLQRYFDTLKSKVRFRFR